MTSQWLTTLRKLATLAAAAFLISEAALADPARDAILKTFAAEAKAVDPGFSGFSAARGEAFWFATHSGGKPDTPTCTSCHSKDPGTPGETRAGKRIEPMAVSVNPARFTKPDEVAKWFERNCNSVLGRPCSPAEKGDVITFLSGK